MDQNTTATSSENPDVDIELIASHMSQYGEGEICLIDTYWSEGIAIIQINNVQKRNAVSGKMMADFRDCVAKLESWNEGKAVILYGSGGNFCSGGDLDYARKCNGQRDGFHLSTLMHDILRRLENLPLISIALIHGPTLGGGAEIAIACDYILACEDAKLGFVHGKMGIITAWGGTNRLINAIGRKKALDLLLMSKILDAKECLNLELASEIINNENKLEECLNWTRTRVKHDYTVTRAFKQAVVAHSKNIREESLNNERKIFIPLWGGQANMSALSQNLKHIKHKF